MSSNGEDNTQSLVHESLCNFLQSHVSDIKSEDIDEIILSYVVSVIEELTEEAEDDARDSFDVEAFVEMLLAYLPQAQGIPQEKITQWMLQLVHQLKNREQEERNFDLDLKSVIQVSTAAALSKSKSSGVGGVGGVMGRGGGAKMLSHSSSSSCSDASADLFEPKHNRRVTRLSETSDGGSDPGSLDGEDFQQTVRHLLEMFPYSCALEVSHCLQFMGGDVERAAQLIMHRHEAGQSLKPTDRKIKTNKTKHDDKAVKDNILGKYGFVDQDEDGRYHRPTLKTNEDKKMIRYRDGKIVSTKGERFTQVSKQESEEMKKSIVTIPNSY